MVSGSADNTAKLWDVSNGKCLKSWEFNTAVRCVQFSEDDKLVLIVTEPRMGYPATLQIFSVENGTTETGMFYDIFYSASFVFLELQKCYYYFDPNG